MPKRIAEDSNDFHNVIRGLLRKELKRLTSTGQIFKLRPKGGKMSVTIPRIDIPHITYGDSHVGVGRGKGKKGDVIGKDKDKGKGPQAGQDEGQGIEVQIDQDEIIQFLQEDLKLPNLKPKPNQTFEDTKIKYNDIAKTGPESLRHNRRTMQQAMKRTCAAGDQDKLYILPGFVDPVRMVTPINSDRRYRQYKEIKIPSSNAAVFYARDWSYSMDDYKCDIVSDMSWWIDCFIRKFYKRVERVFVGHDAIAEECSEEKFYKYKLGGGTTCSSALKLIAKQFENRFPPDMWNIYVLYFTDGENWEEDNKIFTQTLAEQFGPEVVNLVGVTQIQSWRYEGSIKEHVDKEIAGNRLDPEVVRTTAVGKTPDKAGGGMGFGGSPTMTDEERANMIKLAIQHLLGATDKVRAGAFSSMSAV